MPWDDLDEQLQQLGYGNMWQAQTQRLAQLKQLKDDSDLKRLKQWQAKNKEKFRAACKRWYDKRKQQTKHRIGELCVSCRTAMKQVDLIGQNRKPGHCLKCRKANK